MTRINCSNWFDGKREWKKEIESMLKHGFKMEVESPRTKSIRFVTEEYVPPTAPAAGEVAALTFSTKPPMASAALREKWEGVSNRFPGVCATS